MPSSAALAAPAGDVGAGVVPIRWEPDQIAGRTSRRARAALLASGLVSREEDVVVGKVLNAAALTYVAATLTSVLTLLYFLFRSGLLGGRRD